MTKILVNYCKWLYTINMLIIFDIYMFTQWVQDYADYADWRLTDAQRVLKFLDRYPDEAPGVIIPYIFQHYPDALSDNNVFQRLIIRINGLDDAEKLYHSLPDDLLQEQVIISLLSLGAPLLFWKYFNPSGARVHHEYVRELYTSLTPKQRKIYAVAALTLGGYLLQYLTPKQRTLKLCMLAVKNDGYALGYVPERKRTDEIVEAAVSRSSSAMEYASEEQRIKFIELAVMGVEKSGLRRIGGFSDNDWKRPWAKEVFKVIGVDRKKELYKLWKNQRKKDANAWHNNFGR